ncbi:50S ribosomal protein L25 [Candidatus Pantoea edessiphila]|uniref:Large ribosomal subunit protein bL25 n=1 Tax=Candidatus Pantoea edessiphila TaxID=2044610 RepID=A0A2P5SWN7_9GAMM|nr:50S ribosomal protein L25 [Candidatus Pantoea edessiphila]PPI86734.1 50S ribosomal protein L25 [Candidatus Pantoea edessiphila]
MITINAIERKDTGKGASRRLRAKNFFPAIIYDTCGCNIPISLDHNYIMNLQINIKFYQETIKIIVNDMEKQVKIQEIQRHPYKPKITHIDFMVV